MANKNRTSEIEFNIVEHIGAIGTPSTAGWKKELNVVEWNTGTPKFDIRDWDEGHEHMSRGITLTEVELRALKELLNTLEDL